MIIKIDFQMSHPVHSVIKYTNMHYKKLIGGNI